MNDDSHNGRTDQDLLVATLTLDDPSKDPALCNEPPPLNGTVYIDGDYHLSPLIEQLRCNNCSHRARHRNGWRIVIGDKKYLIGSECGPKYFNLSFGEAKANHKRLQDRQNYLLRLVKIYERSDSFKCELRTIVDCKGLGQLASKRQELATACPDFVTRLRSFCIGGSPLSEQVQVRDLNAEARRRVDDENKEPIYKFETVSLGHLAGRAMIYQDLECQELTQRLFVGLHKIDALGAELKYKGMIGATTAQLKAIVMAVEAEEKALSLAMSQVETAHHFFSPDNLDRMRRWSVGIDSFDLELNGRDLVFRMGRKETRVSSLQALTLPRILG